VTEELITRQQLEKSEVGHYDIPFRVLVEMPNFLFVEAADALNTLVNNNPDYIFTSEDLLDGGIRVSWRKERHMHWHGNTMCVEATCSPSNIPDNNHR